MDLLECGLDTVSYAELESMLKLHEASNKVRLKPYKDSVGILTIGWGRNLEDRGITVEEADLMLKNDIKDHCEGILALQPWIKDIDPVRRNVLFDMSYNLGWTGLNKWKTFLALVKTGNYEHAADYMLNTKWARQVKSRAVRLSKMMRTGIYEL